MLRMMSNLALSDEEQQVLEIAHDVCQKEIVPVRAEMDEHETYPEHIFRKFRQVGLFEAMFEQEYGGLGMTKLMPFLILEVVAQYCLGVATAFGASTNLAALPIKLGGTADQKERYLSRIVTGEYIAALGVTEPNAGSDVLSLTTTATKQGDRYILNGTKQWITNAGRADIYCIFARIEKSRSLGCFIVEKETPGLSFGKLENKLGIRCSHTRQVIMTDLEVPEENLVGLSPKHGLPYLLRTLNRSRAGVAALGVGLSIGAYKEAAKYARQREQFNKKIIHFQAVQHMLADMLVKIEAARMLAYTAGEYAVEDRLEAETSSAIAKYYASEVAMQIATDAVQIHGGYGFSKEYPVEKMFRDAKILAIYEGTNQMLKNQIGDHILRSSARF